MFLQQKLDEHTVKQCILAVQTRIWSHREHVELILFNNQLSANSGVKTQFGLLPHAFPRHGIPEPRNSPGSTAAHPAPTAADPHEPRPS